MCVHVCTCVLQHLSSSSTVAKRKHLERWELQECSLERLSSLKASLQQDVHGACVHTHTYFHTLLIMKDLSSFCTKSDGLEPGAVLQ